MNDQQLIFDLCNKAFGVHFAQLIVCQAIHETGNFTSKNLEQNNNYFGYGYVKGAHWQKPRQNGEHDKDTYYAGYATRENSVLEIIEYYQRRMKECYFKNSGRIAIWDFVNDLKKAGYFTDSVANYYHGVSDAYLKILLPEIRNFVNQ